VLCIGLNRPEKCSAIDVELYLALADAYGELQRDDELRCGLLYGEGKHFCAGLELDKWGPQFASFPGRRTRIRPPLSNDLPRFAGL
jgi:enoyl-CoA hydratase/carnithine racemase